MVEDFIACYIKKIVRNPDLVSVECKQTDEGYEYIIYAASEDIGKIVGKDGKMITSIKAFITGCKAKDGLSYKIMAKGLDD